VSQFCSSLQTPPRKWFDLDHRGRDNEGWKIARETSKMKPTGMVDIEEA
jgi:hypothetical protein